MIAFIRGEIAAITEDNVIIDTGSFGVNVKISTGTVNRLPGIGQELRLFTYTHVREDIFQLYGFLSGDELTIFKQLITVNGIGPKGGLAVLSAMSADDLRFAILAGDSKAIAKAPGIGPKTAERIILDLRDKVSAHISANNQEMDPYIGTGDVGLSGGVDRARNEAVEALVALGYGATEALRAVRAVPDSADMDTEALLKSALRNMF
jgi:Holliday junction DNA helicase RuvA